VTVEGSIGEMRGKLNVSMGLFPKSAEIVSYRPPLWRVSKEKMSWRALLCRSCRRPDMGGQLLAIRQLLVKCPHMG
jgi:hypothetical protein